METGSRVAEDDTELLTLQSPPTSSLGGLLCLPPLPSHALSTLWCVSKLQFVLWPDDLYPHGLMLSFIDGLASGSASVNTAATDTWTCVRVDRSFI